MPHPNDLALNEYLDGTLTPAAAVTLAQHLAACPTCAARYAALRAVFTALEALPDAPLQIDLAARVVSHLPTRQSSDFRLPTSNFPLSASRFPAFIQWLAALQLASVLVVLVLSGSFIETALNFSPLLPPFTWETGLAPLLADWAAAWTELWRNLPSALPTLPLDPFLAALAVGSLAALWLVGNGLLLRPHSRK